MLVGRIGKVGRRGHGCGLGMVGGEVNLAAAQAWLQIVTQDERQASYWIRTRQPVLVPQGAWTVPGAMPK